jgi:hypothetical protein
MFLAIGSLALVALLGVTLIGRSGAGAQDTATPDTSGTPAAGSSSDSEPTRDAMKDTYLATLAEKLGITPEQLQTAIDETNTELGIDGAFGALGMDGPRGGHRGGNDGSGWGGPNGADIEEGEQHDGNHSGKSGSMLRGIDIAEAATFLGITEDELKTDLKTAAFLDIAQSHGKTIDDVRAFLIQQATADIDERLQEAETAPASESATEPAEENSSISDATEVPAAPTLTPTATA